MNKKYFSFTDNKLFSVNISYENLPLEIYRLTHYLVAQFQN
ncbi:hypothetical protein P7M46_01575 [Bisgaard Taxon 10/6]|nr:hypothetical protein [Exercitatus varius]MDG2915006.1 hypothetical protein [Exercitatus varius]MDG2916706.1 hypothetical protein [Exercitatus varius]MDG2941429.1 hypothetical protein [Exercitatus varius]MDG2955417.1 hypothetical protein [Exercitatus varius]